MLSLISILQIFHIHDFIIFSNLQITDQQSLQMSQSVSHAEVSEAGITNGKPSSRADLRLQNKQEMTPMNLIAKSNFATERSSFASGLSADETTYNSGNSFSFTIVSHISVIAFVRIKQYLLQFEHAVS